MVDYETLSKQVDEYKLNHHASELHGVVTGFVCGGATDERLSALLDWLGLDQSDGERGFFLQMMKDARQQLADPELGFEPLIPRDQQGLAVRSRAVSLWCTGFISGFGAAGDVSEADIDDEVREVISDLHKISVMTDEVPESDENEADLTEIIEYVRVTALLVFATCALTDRQEGQ